jgi:Pyridoxamine 5'-phosphate oxidase
MSLTELDRQFIADNPSAAMITLAADGTPRAVRVVVTMFDGRLWSTGTQDRFRTKHLRRDPRCTLFLFEPAHGFLTLETRVRILDGTDAPKLNLALARLRQRRPQGPLLWLGDHLDEAAFLAQMVKEKRVIYEFEVQRSYGRP